jgi:hypothetical protein
MDFTALHLLAFNYLRFKLYCFVACCLFHHRPTVAPTHKPIDEFTATLPTVAPDSIALANKILKNGN